MKPLFPRSLFFILLISSAILTGCEKKEDPVVLPPKGNALPGRVDMGENYETQLFYDFATNKVVKTSPVASWDLAFESGPDGRHVFMNGGKNIFVYNTHATDFATFTTLPSNINQNTWQVDAPCGLPDSTGVGEWMTNGVSKNEVYIAQLDAATSTYKKFRLVLVNSQSYKLQYGDLSDPAPTTIELTKDNNYNYIYFSFRDGIVTPEPPKASWDVVFTRYRYIYRDLNNFTYLVNGALLNPYQTVASADSTHPFEDITQVLALNLPYTNFRDAIGFDWKNYNFNSGRYEIKRNKNYMIRNRNNQLYKLRFLDFYSPTGAKGSPSFEYERLQ